jgi:hypothetical protein
MQADPGMTEAESDEGLDSEARTLHEQLGGSSFLVLQCEGATITWGASGSDLELSAAARILAQIIEQQIFDSMIADEGEESEGEDEDESGPE